MKNPLLAISAIVTNGIPLANSVIGLFKKKKSLLPENVEATTKEQLVEILKTQESDKGSLVKVANLVGEAIVVLLFVIAIKKLGVTYNDISSLFTLIK